MPYRVAADAHWLTAGSTHQAGPAALPTRTATRTYASEPMSLTVYGLADDHDNALAEFAARHGRDDTMPTGRHALAVYAAGVAADSPDAAADYEVQQLVATLRVALTIGDAEQILGGMTCPKCLCWSLLGVRDPDSRWRAACQNLRCAYDPDPTDGEEDADGPAPAQLKPRTWSLHKVARHNLTRAA